jgi:hypothetical protein
MVSTLRGAKMLKTGAMTVYAIRGTAVAAMLLFAAACSQSSPQTQTSPQNQDVAPSPGAGASSQDSRFEVTATIRELMDFLVDPAADGVWDSVSIVYTQAGADHRRPRTDEQWIAVRREAITLMESMNLVVMDGRHAAPPGTQPGEGELMPAEIDQRMVTDRAEFVAFADGVRAATQKALIAIDKKDADALLEVGGDIDVVCEACHLTFWYPNQKKLPGTAASKLR